MSRIGEEQERTSHKRYIEDIVACTAEYFLYEYNRECGSYGQHPQRRFNRTYHRYQYTRDEEALLDFFFTPLGHNEFNTQAYKIGNHNSGQYCQEAVEQQLPEREYTFTACQPMLVTGIVHAEEEARHQRQHHYNHGALGVDAVVYVYLAGARSGARSVHKGIKAVEHRVEGVEFASLFEVRPNLVEILSELAHCY